MIDRIEHEGVCLAYIVRAEGQPRETRFFTESDANLQVGHVVYPAGSEIPRHVHLPVERRIVGSAEVLVVQSGRCRVDVYTDARELVTTRELVPGDIVISLAGGHGFTLHEDTVLLEVKQGPYPGGTEKQRF